MFIARKAFPGVGCQCTLTATGRAALPAQQRMTCTSKNCWELYKAYIGPEMRRNFWRARTVCPVCYQDVEPLCDNTTLERIFDAPTASQTTELTYDPTSERRMEKKKVPASSTTPEPSAPPKPEPSATPSPQPPASATPRLTPHATPRRQEASHGLCPDRSMVSYDCGEHGMVQAHGLEGAAARCEEKGCCWDPGGLGRPWCYHTAAQMSCEKTCPASYYGSELREDCAAFHILDPGLRDHKDNEIRGKSCQDAGCCWQPLEHGSREPWCFHVPCI